MPAPNGTTLRRGNPRPCRRAVERGHAAQQRIAAAINARTAELVRQAWREGARTDGAVAALLNVQGHRTARIGCLPRRAGDRRAAGRRGERRTARVG